MKVKSKVWLDNRGELIFGFGKSEILKTINQTGSINSAAKLLNMSYRHAWSYIRSAEKRLGKPLLVKTKGGTGGGGARLTDYARELLDKFDKLDLDVKVFANKRFKKLFD